MEKYKTSIYLLVALLVVAVVSFGFIVSDKPTAPEVKVITVDKIVYVPALDNATSNKINYIFNKESVTDVKKLTALDLANSEKATKSFTKEVFSILETKTSIEDYKDITSIVVKKSEVKLDGEDAVVTYQLNVYYYLDGDKEETEKASFTAEYEVTGLDEDKAYVDAEATLSDLTFNKIYEVH